MKVVITRAKEDSSSFEEALTKAGIESFNFPCLEFQKPSDDYKSIDAAIRGNHLYDWVFFLSQNAADVFFSRLIEIGGHFFNLAPHLKFGVIGSSTASFMEKEVGFPVNFMPLKYNSESFLEEFLDKHLDPTFLPGGDKKKILLVRAELDDDSFEEKVKASGQFDIVTVLAYKTTTPSSPDLTSLKIILETEDKVCLSFASSQTVRNFKLLSEGLELDSFKNLRLVSIGPKTTKTVKQELPKLADILSEAKEATLEGMLAACDRIESYARR